MNWEEKEKELEKEHLCRVLWMASCESCRVVHVEAAQLHERHIHADLLKRKLKENQLIYFCSVCKAAKVFTRVEL